jgi:hypothetical protein
MAMLQLRPSCEGSSPRAARIAGAVLRAGFTEVLVTGMLMITNRKIAVMTASHTKPAAIL